MSDKLTRLRRWARNAGIYFGIMVVTLILTDLVLMATGLFPPPHNYGHPELGWVGGRATGEMTEQRCADPVTGDVVLVTRNERGYRTSLPTERLEADSSLYTIAASGDSHTDLCVANELTHFGFMEAELVDHGLNAAAFSYAAGKYSPLQAYLAVKDPIREYDAKAFVLNLYTGNDFYDMLRVDDRPHFVPAGDGYDITPPVWYQEDPPGLQRRSRVLYAIRSIANRTGVLRIWVRVHYLWDVAVAQGQGPGAVVGYMNDLRKSSAPEVFYPQAFLAQMLNQQLFFYHFPGSREESVERVRALLQLVRRENPDLQLILSPVPSYQLVHREATNASLNGVIDRLPITYDDGVADEGGLYAVLEEMAHDYGWIFVDNLEALLAAPDLRELYNEQDYHILPAASRIIGRNQAQTIMTYLEHQP